jgi:hypothetical protein
MEPPINRFPILSFLFYPFCLRETDLRSRCAVSASADNRCAREVINALRHRSMPRVQVFARIAMSVVFGALIVAGRVTRFSMAAFRMPIAG